MWPFRKQTPKSTPSNHEPFPIRNDDLVELLERLQDDPQLRDDIYAGLLDRDLVIGSREPMGSPGQWTVIEEETPITLLTIAGPSDEPALPVFTDAAALYARNDEAFPIGMPAAQLFAMVLEDEYEGIVLNPAANWMFIPREHVETLAEGLRLRIGE
jgi:hypothetical protein